MAYCRSCRAQVADESAFCTNCGTSLGTAAPSMQTGQPTPASTVPVPTRVGSRQMWEYRVDISSDSGDRKIRAQENQRLINQCASEGWELIAVEGYLYFKRAL